MVNDQLSRESRVFRHKKVEQTHFVPVSRAQIPSQYMGTIATTYNSHNTWFGCTGHVEFAFGEFAGWQNYRLRRELLIFAEDDTGIAGCNPQKLKAPVMN